MRYVMHQVLLQATKELSVHLQVREGKVDADLLMPYLMFILVKGFSEGQDLRCVLLLVQYFSAHKFGISEQDYSLSCFVEAESCL